MKVLFVAMLIFHGYVGHTQSKEKDILLGNEERCVYDVSPKAFFNVYGAQMTKTLFMEKTNDQKLIARCSDGRVKIKERDTTILLGNTFFELRYRETYAEKVFDSILSMSQDFEKSRITDFWDFNKPGKLYCLKKDECMIVIISLNSCANGPVYDAIVKSLRKGKKFDKVLAVQCGAESRYNQIF